MGMAFTATEDDTYRMIGLSNGDRHESCTDIDFAVYLMINGRFEIRENGHYLGTWGSYVPGDRFTVQVFNGQVSFGRNDVVVNVSETQARLPLLVDSAFYTTGASMRDAYLVTDALNNVVGVTATGVDMQKTTGNSWTHAGASSNATLASGGGYVESTTTPPAVSTVYIRGP